jgi:hypothetical protein
MGTMRELLDEVAGTQAKKPMATGTKGELANVNACGSIL